jgi:hypothetical protein
MHGGFEAVLNQVLLNESMTALIQCFFIPKATFAMER